MARKLTLKQQAWCDAYLAGNTAWKSARIAGYSGNDATMRVRGSKQLSKGNIQEYLANAHKNSPLVASREQRQKFWTDVMNGNITERGNDPKLSDRLRASELLGKTQADFIDRIDHSGSMQHDVTTKVDLSGMSKDELKSFLALLDKAKKR